MILADTIPTRINSLLVETKYNAVIADEDETIPKNWMASHLKII
jgi:hypothetical protein